MLDKVILYTIVIMTTTIIILFICMVLGMDKDKFKSKFMRNPTRINVIHTKSGKRWSKLFNLKNGEKSVRDAKETERIIDWDYAYGHRGISDFYYVDDSAMPVKFGDFQKHLSASEMQDLAILFMVAGATDYIPLLVKQIINALLPWIIFTLIASIIGAVLAGIAMGTISSTQAHVSAIETTLGMIKNNTVSKLVG